MYRRLPFFIAGLFVQTAAHAGVVTDGTVGRATTLSGPNYAITASLGTQVGGNLFHSFSTFNIATGESATFSGPNSIANIIARVTGGSQSSINGAISSTIQQANLYLVNPAGIVFGANASLNVGGSFYASTANYVKLADGGRFDAANPANDLLTSAPVAAFGFLGPNVAPISVAGSLSVAPGASISLIGGNIDMTNATLTANGGQIGIAAVASTGEVGVSAFGPDTSAMAQSGAISLSGSMLDVNEAANSSSGSGSIYIRGGQITLGAASGVTSSTVNGNGGNIDMAATGNMNVDNSLIQAQTSGSGNGGNVSIAATNLALTGGGQISSTAQAGSTGWGGIIQATVKDTVSVAGSDVNNNPSGIFGRTYGAGSGGIVDILSKSLNLDNNGTISASAYSSGFGGSVAITASGLISIVNGATIAANSYGSGDGGYISLKSGQLSLDRGYIASKVAASGWGGVISIDTGNLTMVNGGLINSNGLSGSSGSLANIQIVATDSIAISGKDANGSSSGIYGQVYGTGNGGNIDVQAKNMSLNSGGLITASSYAAGSAGSISLKATALNVNGGYVGSTVHGGGAGGQISIDTGTLTLAAGGNVDSTAYTGSSGNLGNITIKATDSIAISGMDANNNSAGIYGQAQGIGHGGNIEITTGNLSMGSNAVVSASSFDRGIGGAISINASGLISVGTGGNVYANAWSSGNGGTISLKAAAVDVNGGYIGSTVHGSGAGGQISIDTGTLSLINGGIIDSTGADASSGNLGSISITARDSVLISGAGNNNTSGIYGTIGGSGNGGNVDIAAPKLTLSQGGLINVSSSYAGVNPGAGASITLNAGELNLDGGMIQSVVLGSGNGGAIAVNGAKLTMVNGGQIDVSSFGGTSGNLGSINIVTTDSVVISGQDSLGTSSGLYAQVSGSGNGGSVDLRTGTLLVSQNGTIDLGSFSSGRGGDLTVNAAKSIAISSGARIYSDSLANGDGGSIVLNSPQLSLDGAQIIASANGTGFGGYIQVNVGNLSLTNGGRIDASTTGPGWGGDINITATNSVSLSGGSQITSQSSGSGTAGSLSIDAGLSFMSDGSVLTTGATQADGGNISLIAKNLIYMNNSSVSAMVGTGLGNGGNIFIDPLLVVMNGSNITANAFGGAGGNINLIATNFLRSQNSSVTASSRLGVSGTVTVTSQFTDLSGSLIGLPVIYLDATGLLGVRCAAQSSAGVSSFVLLGKGGIPPSPDGYLPSISSAALTPANSAVHYSATTPGCSA